MKKALMIAFAALILIVVILVLSSSKSYIPFINADISDAEISAAALPEPENEKKLKIDRKKTVVIDKEGIKMRTGPTTDCDELRGKIKFGTVLEYEYVDSSEEKWAYVNYKGKNGWIYITQDDSYGTASPIDDGTPEITVYAKECYLTETPDPESEKISENIPVGTVLKKELSYKKSVNGSYQLSYYVEYNSVKGWISNWKASEHIEGGYYCVYGIDKTNGINGTNLYADPTDRKSETQIFIPKGTILAVDEIFGYTTYHVSYKGNEGWIHMEADIFNYTDIIRDYRVISPDGLKVHKREDSESEVIAVIEKDEIFSAIYCLYYCGAGVWSYTEVDGVWGWVDINETDMVEYIKGSERNCGNILGAEYIE